MVVAGVAYGKGVWYSFSCHPPLSSQACGGAQHMPWPHRLPLHASHRCSSVRVIHGGSCWCAAEQHPGKIGYCAAPAKQRHSTAMPGSSQHTPQLASQKLHAMLPSRSGDFCCTQHGTSVTHHTRVCVHTPAHICTRSHTFSHTHTRCYRPAHQGEQGGV